MFVITRWKHGEHGVVSRMGYPLLEALLIRGDVGPPEGCSTRFSAWQLPTMAQTSTLANIHQNVGSKLRIALKEAARQEWPLDKVGEGAVDLGVSLSLYCVS